MAVDTQEKRMNAAHCGRPWKRGKFPTGGFDEQARISIGHAYGGNALSPGPVDAVLSPTLVTSFFEATSAGSFFESAANPGYFEATSQPGSKT